MPVIGLTGNFGMGKSTVLELFHQLGAVTYNVDTFVHEILEHPEMIRRIADVLGREVLVKNSTNISLNKKMVADLIFMDTQKRKAVEGLIHPEVLEAVKLAASEALRKDKSAVVIIEVPLLFEAGYEHYFDKVIVVHCSSRIAFGRLSQKGFTEEEATRRSSAQMPISAKKNNADFLIDNSGTTADAKRKVKEIYENLTGH